MIDYSLFWYARRITITAFDKEAEAIICENVGKLLKISDMVSLNISILHFSICSMPTAIDKLSFTQTTVNNYDQSLVPTNRPILNVYTIMFYFEFQYMHRLQ